ncbi:PREDICTED: F-box only protein 6-like [Nicrophorus vespilloides]|uniref:F-box only protein 6-like n=1 Tax=Nicrophorus vespilloides TaxID=110193 RepID=A0ABM1NCK6_NICVS|nr:PREDICTED: F-box only protein 6-like [Nicrophorus vespilloides]
MGLVNSAASTQQPVNPETPITKHNIVQPEMEDDIALNGYKLLQYYMPEEILIQILSFVPTKDLLKCSEVCVNWNKWIKSDIVWILKFKREKKQKPKKVPWFVYYAALGLDFFDNNFIKNGNGQDIYENWKINKKFSNHWIIENPPVGCDPLPLDIDDFNGHQSCFVTSFEKCNKEQVIKISNPMLKQILNDFKPHIYVSEWVCGRYDCGCTYSMTIKLVTDDGSVHKNEIVKYTIQQWSNPAWKKLETTVKNYPKNIAKIIFEHEGKDSLFWAGHYGSKMAGAVVKILFDTIQDQKQCS